MKILLLLSFLISLPTHAMKPEIFKSSIERMASENKEKIQQCNNQLESITKRAYTEVDTEEGVSFIQDESKALEYMNRIEFKKFYDSLENEPFKLYVKNCSDSTAKIYETFSKNNIYCEWIPSNFDFMRALIFATKNYKWSVATKNKVKNFTISFINQSIDKKDVPLLIRFIEVSLVRIMGQFDLLPPAIIKEMETISSKAEAKLDAFRKINKNKVSKFKAKSTATQDCLLSAENYKSEMELSNSLASEIKRVLKK